jgi:imidazolonepropionase-like amidohydrolase
MTGEGSWKLPSTLLPDGERADRWLRDGRLTSEPVAGAKPLPGRFALPGLVDAHAHLTMGPDRPDSLEATTDRLRALGRDGVLAVRDIGAPRSLTLELRPAPDLPSLQVAGRWHAPEGRFFPPLHDPVPPEGLIDAALAEVARGARWVKVIADWRDGALSYDAALLTQLVEAVHGAGARVAAHTQAAVARDVVAAGVDSIEHGCLLDAAAIEVMAARGLAWTPTLTAFGTPLPDDATPAQHGRWTAYRDNTMAMLPFAASRGVTILAGTDTAGTVVDEVRHLIEYGLTPVHALRAASTDARRFLGIGSADEAGPADVVTYEDDPRDDPDVLAHPVAVVMRGRRIR